MINLEHELENTYTVRQIDDLHHVFTWTVPTGLSYFDGHFPGQPVLPAVALIDISEFFIKRTFQRSTNLTCVPIAKIKAAISRNDVVLVNIKKSGENKEYLCQWSFAETSDKIITEIRLIL